MVFATLPGELLFNGSGAQRIRRGCVGGSPAPWVDDMKAEPRREYVRTASQRPRRFSMRALTLVSLRASSLRWSLAILVLILVACGTHERQAVDGLGTAVSAATSTAPPVLRDQLEFPPASIVRGDDVGYLP